jgi:hypothetical protein
MGPSIGEIIGSSELSLASLLGVGVGVGVELLLGVAFFLPKFSERLRRSGRGWLAAGEEGPGASSVSDQYKARTSLPLSSVFSL